MKFMKNSGIILIFGATGDLSRRKLIPALYGLIAAGKLEDWQLVGAALESKTAQQILDSAQEFIPNLNPVIWQKLAAKFSYCPVDINNPKDFEELAKLIHDLRKTYDLADQTLVYCAVFESLYVSLTKQLASVGIIWRILEKSGLPGRSSKNEAWCRVVYEKPFGHSYESVHKLNQDILKFLDESQIYRVDHYLAKEIVGNIAFVRFMNRIFEAIWDHINIEAIYITLDENLDIEGRGKYYEQYGVVKDVVQNHALQLLALMTMDCPKSLNGSDIADAKSNILKKIQCKDGILGQYAGYRDEAHVSSDSKTPTFAELIFFFFYPRWTGVPCYVRAGKVMPQKKTQIVVKFKDSRCLLPRNCPTDTRNSLIIDIYPNGGFDLEINAKKPGVNDEIVPIKMSSCYDALFVPQALGAYENVISEIMTGDTSFAVRLDEIEACWRVCDQITALNLPLYVYAKNSLGPAELVKFNQKYKMIWK